MARGQQRQRDPATALVYLGPRERGKGLWSAVRRRRPKPMERERTELQKAPSRYGRAAC